MSTFSIRFLLSLTLLLGLGSLAIGQTTTISGKVSDEGTGEDLIFATVFVKGTTQGVSTNEYGFFSLTVDDESIAGDTFEVVVSYVGFNNKSHQVVKGKDTQLEVKMKLNTNTLKAVEVVEEQSSMEEELRSTRMSTIHIPMKEIKYVPSLGGETDIVKVMQLMPGVSRGTEGTTGMFVRGGDADQNLVLLDEATVYNVGHLFGFFSVFNVDAINDMTMIKGGFPGNYGGRLSSILDIRMKEGNLNKFHARGGVGLLSSRLTLEGPIKKDEASFLVSGRRTYIDKVYSALGANLPYYFYDLNVKLNWKPTDKDRLFFSSYLGNDVLKLSGESNQSDSTGENFDFGFGFTLGNVTNTLRWNHIYNNKLFSNISLITTNFNYDISGEFGSNNVLVRSKIRDYGVKADYHWYRSSKSLIKYGAHVVHHSFQPNVISTAGEISEFLESNEAANIDFQEMALYGNAENDIIKHVLKVNMGLRLSASNTSDAFYSALEPRFSTRYSISEKTSLKASYSRMKQYMHRVSSSTVSLPTDLWYPVTGTIKPQSSDQIAFGYHHLYLRRQLSLTIETYYKWMTNLIEYREGANLILNENFEEELVQGTGDSYGIEMLWKKEGGKFTGWIGYTLSWATRDFDELNDGKRFFAKYDRRHDLSIVYNRKIGKKGRWHFSGVLVSSTGPRFTAQVGQYLMPNPSLTGVDIIPIYTDRNEVKMSSSSRVDLNFVLKPKKKRKWHGEWHFGCYNFFNRATPFQIEIVPLEDEIGYKYQQPGLFGFIPSVAYNFEF